MDNLGKRIKLARETFSEKVMTQEGLGKASGISQTTVADIERGRNKGTKHIVALAKALRVSIEWLNDDKGEMRPDAGQQANTESIEIKGHVPLISWVTAGKFCNVEDPYEVGDAEEWLPCPVKHSSKTYALRVIGDSMLNPGDEYSFKTGDIIFVDPEREYVHRSLVILRLDDENQATFKRLLIDGERRMLEALNPSWPDRITEISGNVTICGVVVAKMESFIGI